MNMLMQAVIWDRLSGFDNSVYKLVSGFMSDGLTYFMKFISFVGSSWILIPIVVLIFAVSFVYKKIRLQSLAIAINLAAVSLLNNAIKVIIQRPRPDILQLVEIGGYSFPSWHAMTAIAFFGFNLYLVMKYFKHRAKYLIAGIAAFLILAIGVSRIYLGVHYASDVLGGYILGFLWIVLFIWLTNRFIFRNRA